MSMQENPWRFRLWHGIIVAMLALIVGLTSGTAYAMTKPDPINASRWRGAIKGYDPVAYFTEGKPVKGKRAHSYEWMGATWYFAHADHQAAFAKEPEKYAPQYGGYCAYAVSMGTVAGIDPQAWAIVDGKLYLNLSPHVQQLWKQDISGHIAHADANWPKIMQGEL
jgi:YHS domain-containing protein